MQLLLRIKLFFLLPLILYGCTPTLPPPSQTFTPWPKRENVLKHLKTYRLEGKVAITAKNGSGSANVMWSKSPLSYTLTLFGPLGSNRMQLKGYPGLVYIETADGKRLTAKTPEALLKQVNINLPVSYLDYWVRGLPVPSLHSSLQIDTYGRLIGLTQDAWHVDFLKYSRVDQLDLPTKISITGPFLKVKIIIYNWSI